MIDTDDGFLPLLARRARDNPADMFAQFEGAPLSFAELDRTANALAFWMRHNGIVPGDAVALMIRNSPLALALLFAIAKAGAVWVPVNPQGRGENLGYIFNHAAPKLIVAETALMATIGASGANLDGVQVFTAEAVQAVANGRGEAPSWNEAAPAADATFAVMYTSGTTGRPKGVLVSHRML